MHKLFVSVCALLKEKSTSSHTISLHNRLEILYYKEYSPKLIKKLYF